MIRGMAAHDELLALADEYWEGVLVASPILYAAESLGSTVRVLVNVE